MSWNGAERCLTVRVAGKPDEGSPDSAADTEQPGPRRAGFEQGLDAVSVSFRRYMLRPLDPIPAFVYAILRLPTNRREQGTRPRVLT